MALDAQILLSILAHETASGDISRTLRATPATYSLSLSNGTGANQAQVVWSDARTISASETLNLASLADTRDGATVTVAFTAVKTVYVRNTHDTNTLRIGGTTLGAFDGLPAGFFRSLPPGGCYLMTSPSDAGMTGISAQFAPASGEVTYELILIGEGTIT
jgi:hypothetical protein